MNVPSGWELVLVLLVIVVVFGSKRLPDSARALGRSMRILKAETKGLHDDDTPAVTAGTPAAGQHLPGQQAQHLPAQPAQHLQAQPVQPAQAFGAGSVPVTPEVAGPTIEQQRQP